MSDQPRPSLGRIVLFRDPAIQGEVELPAIICGVVNDTTVDLTVIDYGQTFGERRVLFVDPDANPGLAVAQPRSWRWPPRV